MGKYPRQQWDIEHRIECVHAVDDGALLLARTRDALHRLRNEVFAELREGS